MDSKLDKLLEKYWEAETNLQEEEELKALLEESKDPSHDSAKGLMDYFDTQAKQQLELEVTAEEDRRFFLLSSQGVK